MEYALDFENSDGDNSQYCFEIKKGVENVYIQKNGNILIGNKSYLPKDVKFVFGTPIGQANIVMTDEQLRAHLPSS